MSEAPKSGNWAHVRARTVAVLVVYHAVFVVAWLTFYASAQHIPVRWRRDVDTVTLPRLETWLFGRYYGSSMRKHLALDIAAALPYMLHFAVPFAFLFAAILANRVAPNSRARPLSFAGALATCSLLMHIMQILYPTAAPWYTEKQGHAAASYTMHGDAGGLNRLDTALNTTFFFKMYAGNPIVFGSMPSMHQAWPLVVLMYQWSWTGRALSLMHAVWIGWAALRLYHHFILDLIGGYLFVILGIWLSRVLWIVLGRALGGPQGFLGYCDAAPDVPRTAWGGALVAALTLQGFTPFSAPDVLLPSMDAHARMVWAPDLGDAPSVSQKSNV
jgi:membrane-associated phospholipid phosphatase